jgi:hypothetical protein
MGGVTLKRFPLEGLIVQHWLVVIEPNLLSSGAHLAQTMARKPARLASDSYLWSQVKKLLKQRYSPE